MPVGVVKEREEREERGERGERKEGERKERKERKERRERRGGGGGKKEERREMKRRRSRRRGGGVPISLRLEQILTRIFSSFLNLHRISPRPAQMSILVQAVLRLDEQC